MDEDEEEYEYGDDDEPRDEEDVEHCPDCGEELHGSGRTTVREFIAMLMRDVYDLDSEIMISLQSADNTVSLELLSVVDLEDLEDPTVLFIAGFPNAWKTETGDDCGSGVLILENFEFPSMKDKPDE